MKIRKAVLEELINHAKKEAPLEACGYLAAKDGAIAASYAMTNTDKSAEHFSFDPKEQFSAVRDARRKGLEICAVYHSHPDSPARPSEEDIRLAYDRRMLYVIVSLLGGKAQMRAFKITDDKAEAVKLEVTDGV